MRIVLFRFVALSLTAMAGMAIGLADKATADSVHDRISAAVTTDLSGLGKAVTIPAYARGAATEVKGVIELKRQHRTETSTESRPRHFGPGHRAH